MTYLFVHGAAADGRMWDVNRQLTAQASAAPTLAGFGTGSEAALPFTLEAQTDGLVQCLDEIDGDVSIIAWSMGCLPALEAMKARPARVASALLYETGVPDFADPADLSAFGADAEAFYGPIVADVMAGALEQSVISMIDASGGTGCYASLDTHYQRVMRDNAGTMAKLFSAPPPPIEIESYRVIDTPLHFRWGDATRPVFRLPSSGASARFGKDNTVDSVPGADHLWPMRDPAAFMRFAEALLA